MTSRERLCRSPMSSESRSLGHYTYPCPAYLPSCLYYWGMCGLLMGLTLYRPAYSADALKGSILDAQIWRELWSMYILARPLFWHLSIRIAYVCRSTRCSTFTRISTSAPCESHLAIRASIRPGSGSIPSSARTTGSRRSCCSVWSRSPVGISAVSYEACGGVWTDGSQQSHMSAWRCISCIAGRGRSTAGIRRSLTRRCFRGSGGRCSRRSTRSRRYSAHDERI